MSITDIAAILGGIAAIAGLVFGLWEFRRKTDLEMFRAHTEKYNKIITPEIHDKWNKACNSKNPKEWEGLDHIAIAFLNLVWEEIYLHKIGVLRNKIWKIWFKEINAVCTKPFAEEMMDKYHFQFLKGELDELKK
jgi:hypothetical protein